jgi:hypothetical protein
MKKTVSTFLWTIASQVVGLTVFFLYITAIDPLRTHASLVGRLFIVGLPVLVLLFSILGALPGTRRSREVAHT